MSEEKGVKECCCLHQFQIKKHATCEYQLFFCPMLDLRKKHDHKISIHFNNSNNFCCRCRTKRSSINILTACCFATDHMRVAQVRKPGGQRKQYFALDRFMSVAKRAKGFQQTLKSAIFLRTLIGGEQVLQELCDTIRTAFWISGLWASVLKWH